MNAKAKKTRVLLVDDESEFLTATAKALRRRGFDPLTADNGLTALDVLQRVVCDAVVLDIKMPGIDGEQVFYEIRRRWPKLPVVILTGHGTVQQAFKTSRDGLYEYLPKPCDVEELAEALRGAVRLGRQRVRAGQDIELPLRLLHMHGGSLASHGLGKALLDAGMQVYDSTNTTQALTVIKNQNVDVILLDLTTVPVRGRDLVRIVRDQQQFAEVVLLADRRTVRHGIDALREGAFDLLVLPVDAQTVVERVRSARARGAVRSAQDTDRMVREILERYPD